MAGEAPSMDLNDAQSSPFPVAREANCSVVVNDAFWAAFTNPTTSYLDLYECWGGVQLNRQNEGRARQLWHAQTSVLHVEPAPPARYFVLLCPGSPSLMPLATIAGHEEHGGRTVASSTSSASASSEEDSPPSLLQVPRSIESDRCQAFITYKGLCYKLLICHFDLADRLAEYHGLGWKWWEPVDDNWGGRDGNFPTEPDFAVVKGGDSGDPFGRGRIEGEMLGFLLVKFSSVECILTHAKEALCSPQTKTQVKDMTHISDASQGLYGELGKHLRGRTRVNNVGLLGLDGLVVFDVHRRWQDEEASSSTGSIRPSTITALVLWREVYCFSAAAAQALTAAADGLLLSEMEPKILSLAAAVFAFGRHCTEHGQGSG